MFDPYQRSRRGGDAATDAAGGAPGRRTLTMALPPRSDAPVPRATAPSLPPPAADPGAQQRDLDAALRPDLFSRMEAMGGVDLGDVRVHRDSPEPRALGAHAFAQGTDIHLGPGQEHYLAHEAWHVVQQKQGRVAASAQFAGVAGNADEALEREADEMGALAASGAPITAVAARAPSAGGAVVQRKLDDLLKQVDEKLHESLRKIHEALASRFGKLGRFTADKEWLLDLLARLGVAGTEHTALELELLVKIGAHLAELKPGDWEELQALLICEDDGARALRLRQLVEEKPKKQQDVWSLFGKDDDEEEEEPQVPSTEPLAGWSINSSHWLAGLERLSDLLATFLKKEDEALAAAIRNLVQHEQGQLYADVLEYAATYGPRSKACQRFAEVGGELPKGLDYLMKLVGFDKMLETPDREPIVEGKLHKEHWLCTVGFKALRKLVEEHAKDGGIEEQLRCLSAIKRASNGDALVEVLELLAAGKRDPSSTQIRQCYELYSTLDVNLRARLVELIKVLGLLEPIEDADQKVYLAFHAPPEKPEVVHRAPDEVFEQAEQEGWLHRGEKETLIELLGLESAAAFVDHEMSKKRTGHLRMTLECAVKACDRLRRNKGGRTDTRRDPPLGEHSLIVDTNIAIVLLTPVDQLEERFLPVRKRILQLLQQHKITDLRLTNMTVIELYAAKLTLDEPGEEVKDRLPFYGVPLDVPRNDSSYRRRMRQLEEEGVGESKGAADRSMMLDCFFAETSFEGPLKFITIDRNIIKPLMRQANLDTRAIGGTGSLVKFLGKEESFTTKPTSDERALQVFPVEFEDRDDERNKKEDDKTDDKTDDKKDEKKDEKKEEATKVEVKGGSPKTLFDTPVGTTGCTVRDYMSFIAECGYEVLVCGGAVRDIVCDKDARPNDIDLTTTMPRDELYQKLHEHKKLGRVHLEKIDKLDLIQISRNQNQLDITAGKQGTEKDEKKLDLEQDKKTRDFCMNALYLGLDETEPRDPSGRGVKDAQEKRATHVVELDELEHDLRDRPFEMARLIKFAIRGYQFEAKALEIVRTIFGDVIKKLSIEDREQFYGKMTAKTPRDAIDALEQLGIPNAAIRELFPDKLLGHYEDKTEVYRRDLGTKLPGFDDDKASWQRLHDTPDQRKDESNGRVYQERRGLLVEATSEPIIVDLDFTDHDLAGHAKPHFHIYRWNGKKWDKNGAGLSHTGQPGKAPYQDDVYTGPAPWTWVKGDPSKATSAEELVKCLDLPKGLDVEVSGEMVGFAGVLTIHFRRLQELGAEVLPSLLLAVLNMAKHGAPSIHDESYQTLTRTHGLCFATDDGWAGTFVKRCGLEKRLVVAELPFPLQLRLHRLVRRHHRTDDKVLARAGETLASFDDVAVLLERLELFLEVGDQSIDWMVKTEASDPLALKGTSPDDHRQGIQTGAGALGFTTEMAAATTWARFGGAGGKVDSFDALLLLAREIVAEPLATGCQHDQDGTELHRFTGARAIVTVRVTKGTARLESIEPIVVKEPRRDEVIDAPKSSRSIDARTLEEELVVLLKQARLRGHEVQGHGSQFGIDGGSRACAPIATTAIGRLFRRDGELQRSDVDTLLHDGSLVYAYMRMYQQEVVDMVRLWCEAYGEEEMRQILQTVDDPYFNPAEVPEVMLHHHGIVHADTETIADGDDHIAKALERVRTILEQRDRVGVAIVVGAYTFSITRVGDTVHLFDSHGDPMSRNAFDAGYPLDDWGALVERVTITMKDRMPGKVELKKKLEKNPRSPRDISLSTFVPKT